MRAEYGSGKIDGAGSVEHSKAVAGTRWILAELIHVSVGFLDAGDVWMLTENADRIGEQVDAGVNRHVIEEHGNGRAIGDLRVVLHERVGRHLALVKRRRAHEHRIDAKFGGA